MPQLPSGRHVGIDPSPLDDLLKMADHFGNVHKVMAIKTTGDLEPYLAVVYLVPQDENDPSQRTVSLDRRSSPLPAGLVSVSSGCRLSDWKSLTSDWPIQDKVAFRDFLNGRGQAALNSYLDAVLQAQARLNESDDFLTRVLTGWWSAGIHPSQEEDWEESDGGSPAWDDYDMLAALEQVCRLLPQYREFSEKWQTQARLDAFWNICRQQLSCADWPDAGKSVRACADEARAAGLLDGLDARKRQWLHNQAVMESIELWHALGDQLRAIMPQPYGIIELVVISTPEARHFPEAETDLTKKSGQ